MLRQSFILPNAPQTHHRCCVFCIRLGIFLDGSQSVFDPARAPRGLSRIDPLSRQFFLGSEPHTLWVKCHRDLTDFAIISSFFGFFPKTALSFFGSALKSTEGVLAGVYKSESIQCFADWSGLAPISRRYPLAKVGVDSKQCAPRCPTRQMA